jgi:hypothetical protein
LVEPLARLFIAANELLEAEGRVLKRQAARLLLAAAVGLIVVFLVLFALAYLQYSLYRAFADRLSPALAALIVGGSSLLLALAGLLYIRKLLKSGPTTPPSPDQASLADAKSKLLNAADNADPLQALADEPFTLVGVAIALGALMGLTEGRLSALAYLTRSLSWIFGRITPTTSDAPKNDPPNDPTPDSQSTI